MFDRFMAVRAYVGKTSRESGKGTHWLSVTCGFWYEFSLAGTEARCGFDFEEKRVTLYSGGETRICTSTWPRVGEAVAKLLSLKIKAESEGEVCLSNWDDKAVFVSSFFVSQRDMFESVLRVTGDEEGDWEVKFEDVGKRYQRGKEIMERGEMVGFGIMLYARAFYDDGAGDWRGKSDNEVLGLGVEDLDEATGWAVEMAKRGETNAIH